MLLSLWQFLVEQWQLVRVRVVLVGWKVWLQLSLMCQFCLCVLFLMCVLEQVLFRLKVLKWVVRMLLFSMVRQLLVICSFRLVVRVLFMLCWQVKLVNRLLLLLYWCVWFRVKLQCDRLGCMDFGIEVNGMLKFDMLLLVLNIWIFRLLVQVLLQRLLMMNGLGVIFILWIFLLFWLIIICVVVVVVLCICGVQWCRDLGSMWLLVVRFRLWQLMLLSRLLVVQFFFVVSLLCQVGKVCWVQVWMLFYLCLVCLLQWEQVQLDWWCKCYRLRLMLLFRLIQVQFDCFDLLLWYLE